ncbi:HAD family hydrolase [Duganella sp. Root198D2]|uniref:HAD family hydrolase n=1 Tax=Duganella sp. Root198D2 TaxID=1736489 RepID=UPI001E572D3C|nr:HAD family hydrolase [Duganella sp. Root198D2]
MVKVRAVVFDVYGTIATINSKRSPFAQLLQIGMVKGRAKTANDARTLMTQSWSLQGAADFLGIELTPAELDGLESDLETELDSIALYPDVLPTIRALQRRGIKIAVCSNLAEPYAAPIKRLLPVQLDAYAWSFERQAMKPDRALYEEVCEMLGCAPKQVLMIGDTRSADVDGPRGAGMQSILLDRNQTQDTKDTLSTLNGLLAML